MGVRAGLSREEAAVRAGVSASAGRRWFREAGGMPPMSLSEPSESSRYLTFPERIEIFAGFQLGNSYAQIARGLGRSTSTVTRELDLYKVRPTRPRAEPVRSAGRRRVVGVVCRGC